MLRREGEAKGRQASRLETIDGLLRAGVMWPVIHSATGIDETIYRTLKRAASSHGRARRSDERTRVGSHTVLS